MKKKDPKRHLKFVKAMAKAAGRDVLPEISLPRANRKPYVRHSSKNIMAEKELEKEIIFNLNLRGDCMASKVGEQSTYNSNLIMNGMADIMVFCKKGLVFLEAKTEKGVWRESQKQFKFLCDQYGIEYHIVKSYKDAEEAID